MSAAKPGYEDLVFINCPFDRSYFPLLRATIFAVYRCGFAPISALSVDNGLENRLDKINKCIASAKYGIHDISNTKLSTKKLPRFNMPFELGLFFGAKEFGGKKQREKNAIIFDIAPYRYQEFISDLKGVDIKAHGNDPGKIIKYIRDWLRSASKRKNLPGEVLLIKEYKKFERTIPRSALKIGYRPDNIPYNDYCALVEDAVQIILAAK
jgi:hypothetical protein